MVLEKLAYDESQRKMYIPIWRELVNKNFAISNEVKRAFIDDPDLQQKVTKFITKKIKKEFSIKKRQSS